MRITARGGAPARCRPAATGAGQRLGQFQRVFKRLPHRIGRIQQHARQAGLLGVVDGHAGADDHLDAVGAQVCDAVERVLAGDKAPMLDIQAETVLEVAEYRYVTGVGRSRWPGWAPAAGRAGRAARRHWSPRQSPRRSVHGAGAGRSPPPLPRSRD
ncbi:hypothetical protein G6F50_015408 [Rhizopus delemar]|uniref:Uncharacterized protein n=1 Tax=Rhizopus delemar TaxID=936053 RepID=A0A9P7C4P9_9FUNG|nr:hypothetical protein G6F50_015408 [Rhizopus delemar]